MEDELVVAVYRLPYMWSKMEVQAHMREVRYKSARMWPGKGPCSEIEIEVRETFAPSELGDLDHFLTARWRLYTMLRRGLGFAAVEHPPWPLARARVRKLEENLVAAAGLPAPRSEPLVHFSAGVEVRVGAPKLENPQLRPGQQRQYDR